MSAGTPGARELVSALARRSLGAFLEGGGTLDLRADGPPRVSVLLLLCNRAELTFNCLQTLALRLNRTACEVVVVDNGSTDETPRLLERALGLTVVRNAENVGFPRAVNQAARLASGDYLLLLNNDAQVLGRGIDVAAEYLAANPGVGAVGAKIVFLDGTLQEAGCTVCRNGWPLPYGRGGDPDDAAFAFEREVDFCSGAFLMTPRKLFARLGGLEEEFSPGYFEDPDYCIRVRQAGRRVVYLPGVEVLHYENGTSAGLFDVAELMRRNHGRFTAKHAGWLRGRPDADWPTVLTRTADPLPFRVLLLGDGLAEVVPGLVARMHALGALVTLCLGPADALALGPDLAALPRTTEVLSLSAAEQRGDSLAARARGYDLVVAAEAGRLAVLQTPCALWRNGRLSLLPARTKLAAVA
jgi:GT2 family glycosyltransferase